MTYVLISSKETQLIETKHLLSYLYSSFMINPCTTADKTQEIMNLYFIFLIFRDFFTFKVPNGSCGCGIGSGTGVVGGSGGGGGDGCSSGGRGRGGVICGDGDKNKFNVCYPE